MDGEVGLVEEADWVEGLNSAEGVNLVEEANWVKESEGMDLLDLMEGLTVPLQNTQCLVVL